MSEHTIPHTPSAAHCILPPTPLNLTQWSLLTLKAVLSGHLPASARVSLLLRLRKGFPIGIDPSLPVPTTVRRCRNPPGTQHNSPDFDPIKTLKILSSLKKEIQMGRTAGPFTSPPFPNLQISPLGAVPKKRSEKLRVIHDLSFPRRGGTSVNSRLLEAPCQYIQFDSVLQTIADIGPPCLLAKIDIKDAFRLLRVIPEDQYNLGIQFMGFYFYERCIPFGIHPGPSFFEEFATAVEKICNAEGIPHIPHYADDSLLISRPEDAPSHYQRALSIFRHLGVPLSEDKLIAPSPVVEFLGIVIDCPSMQIRMPEDKLTAYREDINAALAHPNELSLHDIQSLHGILIYASRCVQKGRLFTSHILRDLATALRIVHHEDLIYQTPTVTIPSGDPHKTPAVTTPSGDPHKTPTVTTPSGDPHKTPSVTNDRGNQQKSKGISLTMGSLMELRWWDKCLREWNGVNIIPPSIAHVPQSQRHILYTDACDKGMGAWLLKANGSALYLLHRWTDREISLATRKKRISMPFLEMLSVIRSVFTWQNDLADSAIILRTDCTAVVQGINTNHSKTLQSHQLLLSLFLTTTKNRIFIDCQHIEGLLNVEADALSRAPSPTDTHLYHSYLSKEFFSLPSVSSVPPHRLTQTPIVDLPSEHLGPVWSAFVTPPWRPPPIGLMIMESRDS